MTTIRHTVEPTLTAHTACTGHDLIEWHHEDYGTIRFVPDDGIEGGHDGAVEIHSVDCLGNLERVHVIPPQQWCAIVKHVKRGLPRRDPISRLRHWMAER